MTVKVAMQWHCVNTEADVETGNAGGLHHTEGVN